MANLIDYLKWRGDLSFDAVPFSEIDALVLCQLSYLDFEGLLEKESFTSSVTLSDLYSKFCQTLDYERRIDAGLMISKQSIDVFKLASESNRFGSVSVTGYEFILDPKKEEQFTAFTYLIKDKLSYVCYRGTDDTFVGWKEDFNLAIEDEVPAQADARRYLQTALQRLKGNFCVGGHSKGGNLAVYAAAFANKTVKNRIINVYNNDGPGFIEEITDTNEYKEAINKVHTYIPQSSVIGRLLNHEEKYTIVQSVQKGLMQHDLYSWQLEGKKLVSLAEVTNGSQFVDKTLKEWLKEIEPKQREKVIDAIFEIINTTDANSFKEIKERLFTDVRLMLKKYQSLDDESKKMIMEFFQTLIRTAKNTAMEEIPAFNRTNKE